MPIYTKKILKCSLEHYLRLWELLSVFNKWYSRVFNIKLLAENANNFYFFIMFHHNHGDNGKYNSSTEHHLRIIKKHEVLIQI